MQLNRKHLACWLCAGRPSLPGPVLWLSHETVSGQDKNVILRASNRRLMRRSVDAQGKVVREKSSIASPRPNVTPTIRNAISTKSIVHVLAAEPQSFASDILAECQGLLDDVMRLQAMKSIFRDPAISCHHRPQSYLAQAWGCSPFGATD